MPEILNPDGTAVAVGDVLISSPGLTGEVDFFLPGLADMRAEQRMTAEFVHVLAATGFVEQGAVVVSGPSELDLGGGTRAGGGGQDITLNVPGPGSGYAQVLLYTAEDGTQTWHLPDDVRQDPDAVVARGGTRRTYHVPRVVAPVTGAEGGSRGLIGALGKKVFTLLAFRLVEGAAEFVAEQIAQRWETTHRPYLLRAFSVDDYTTAAAAALSKAELLSMTGGPALLFVHGTFSMAHSGFGTLPRALLMKLHERYNGRVLALNHPSISQSPEDNARWLADHLAANLPADATLQLDVVAHSRGGLVARELITHSDEFGLAGRLQVRKLVMIGVPNAGTVLAQSVHWKHYIDRMTNILQFVPDNPVTDTMDAVLTLLKHVVVGASQGLDGIRAMDPTGDYLASRLNGPGLTHGVALYAVASDYEPPKGSPLLRVARDTVADLVFGSVHNDLVVPTDGVFTVPGAYGFPVAERLVLPSGAGVDHSGYWASAAFAAQILLWLTA